jgi:hypothetical protein
MACLLAKERERMTDNLRRGYRAVTDSDRELGLAWYPEAQRITREWASHYRYSVETVACIIAAISPQVEWTRNLVIADDVLARRMPSVGGVIHTNLRKAEALRDSDYRSDLRDNDGALLWGLDLRMLEQFKAGPKVLNFARNLSGNMDAITIDTHAFQCALNDPLSTQIPRATIYPHIAECYRRVADEVGLAPAIFQAILWHYWKRLYPRVWKQQNRRQWHAIGEF